MGILRKEVIARRSIFALTSNPFSPSSLKGRERDRCSTRGGVFVGGDFTVGNSATASGTGVSRSARHRSMPSYHPPSSHWTKAETVLRPSSNCGFMRLPFLAHAANIQEIGFACSGMQVCNAHPARGGSWPFLGTDRELFRWRKQSRIRRATTLHSDSAADRCSGYVSSPRRRFFIWYRESDFKGHLFAGHDLGEEYFDDLSWRESKLIENFLDLLLYL